MAENKHKPKPIQIVTQELDHLEEIGHFVAGYFTMCQGVIEQGRIRWTGARAERNMHTYLESILSKVKLAQDKLLAIRYLYTGEEQATQSCKEANPAASGDVDAQDNPANSDRIAKERFEVYIAILKEIYELKNRIMLLHETTQQSQHLSLLDKAIYDR